MLSAAMSRHPSRSPTPPWPNWPLAAVPRWRGRKDAAGRRTRRIPPRHNAHSTAVRTDAWVYNHRLSSPLSLRAIHASGGAAAERAGFILRAGELAPSTGAKRYHHQLLDPVQRQPQPARPLMGKALSGG